MARVRLFFHGEPIDVDVEASDAGQRVRIGGRWLSVARIAGDATAGSLFVDGRPVRYLAERTTERIRVAVGGELFTFEIGGGAAKARGGHGVASPQTRSPIPGKVLKLETSVGALVKPGDPLLILEAMKMENVLVAEVAGTVRDIHVVAGEMVDPGKLLVVIEPS